MVRSKIGFALGYPGQPAETEKKLWEKLLEDVKVEKVLPVHRGHLVPEWSVLWPAPHDALAFPGHRQRDTDLVWLAPQPTIGALGSWRGSEDERKAIDALWRAECGDSRKPLKRQMWWKGADFLGWLVFPASRKLSSNAPQPTTRSEMHVAIGTTTYTAEDGKLYGYDTREFLALKSRWRGEDNVDFSSEEIAIGVELVAPGVPVPSGLWKVGGEGRLAWSEVLDSSSIAEFPKDRFEPLLREHNGMRHFRLILCTPAVFDAGWRPDWLELGNHNGEHVYRGQVPSTDLDVILRSAMMERPLAASGWDLALGKPKPSRRLVAPGAVYFFELANAQRALTLPDFENLWMKTMQDPKAQWARDGFGRVVPGAWPIEARASLGNRREG